ncbi:UDP-N-acetylmuramate--L-alanine ligase [Cardinium endosymbiont of Tipula unca]|uniref:UDP-N-acetylmuramate--L-alanine ligase n=1 Tax=Cardinium endosymbiont of Tipula unca TaxID=3066216 RepID=UPI0030CC49C9
MGIGGIGMSALARLFNVQGYKVFGYDKTASPLIMQLKQEGISIYCDDALDAIPEIICKNRTNTLVIYTPAIPLNNAMVNYFKANGYKIQSRAEILGEISNAFPTIAIAGTHGKTTTTAMIAHILYQGRLPMLAFVGGIMNQYETNLLHNSSLSQVKLIVTEADEFNRSFLQLAPTYSLITSVDIDHPETYQTPALMQESFVQFIQQTKQTLVIQHSVADTLQIARFYSSPYLTYGLHAGDILAQRLHVEPHQSTFDYLGCSEKITDIVLPIPGFYNIENALAAITICLKMGVSHTQIRSSIACFPGIKRRFAYVFKSDQCVLIDDYAHHPVEVAALLTSVRKVYPNSLITAIFQPHLFSRTWRLYEAFATSLSLADQVFLLPIYPAREEPIPGVTSKLIFDKLTYNKKTLINMDQLPSILNLFNTTDHRVVITIGAGDIGEAVPAIAEDLKKIFE